VKATGIFKQFVAEIIGDGKLAEEGKVVGSSKTMRGSKRKVTSQDGARKGGGINTQRPSGSRRASKRKPIGIKGSQLQKRMRP
jgi:hypothetical protein